MIKSYLSQKRQLLEPALLEFVALKQQRSMSCELDVKDFLKKFVVSGKLYRGCLVFLGYDLFAQSSSDQLTPRSPIFSSLLQTAIFLELTHSAFLLHDDVMDQDELRRGQPTFHRWVVQQLDGKQFAELDHLGESLAICAGDLFLFWASELVAKICQTYPQSSIATQLSSLYHQEMELTVWGQMDDVCLAASESEADMDQVLNVYSIKSGHYSVVNPLLLGAILAEATQEQLQVLRELAVMLGIIFQIRDDRLNLFEESQKTGKSVGSDISENKKTIYRQLLFAKLVSDDLAIVRRIFGKKQLTALDLEQVKQLMYQYDIPTQVDEVVESYHQQALELKKKLKLKPESAQLLDGLMKVMIERRL